MSPNPVLNPNTPFVIKFLTDEVVGAEINSGTGGDPAKIYAHAQTVIGVANGMLQIAAGDATGGLAAIETAIGSLQSSDPAKAAALQTVLYVVGAKVAALEEAAVGTITGAVINEITTQVANEAIAVATKYPAPAPASGAK